jgi:hypothetical protein
MQTFFTWKRAAVAAALCGGAWVAHANESASGQCSAPAAPGPEVITQRAETISSMEQLPEGCLKRILLQCSDSANQQLMDFGSAAICSMSYEALLRKSFGGNFSAMMAWWRGERGGRGGAQ